jgi:hypothetical protein
MIGGANTQILRSIEGRVVDRASWLQTGLPPGFSAVAWPMKGGIVGGSRSEGTDTPHDKSKRPSEGALGKMD